MARKSKPAGVAISKWRMPEDAAQGSGLIGPNAILQTLPVLDGLLGPKGCRDVLNHAGIAEIPDGNHMIPEALAARLHRQIRLDAPGLASRISAQAGIATANYILANRIPRPAQIVLRCLPAGPAARLLSTAIDKHAWTFAGSGQFSVLTPWKFKIADNPLVRGETDTSCLCSWHAAVFARLYQALVSPECSCQEISCGAQAVASCCEFEIRM